MAIAFRVVVLLPPPVVDVVIPLGDGKQDIEDRIRELHGFVNKRLPLSTVITIAGHASTDIVERLAAELVGVRVLRLNRRGRARALAAAWMTSEARVVAAVDIDRTADFEIVPRLIAPVLTGRSAISIGPGFKAMRSDAARRLIPQVISRGSLFDAELLLRAAQSSLSRTFGGRRGVLYAN